MLTDREIISTLEMLENENLDVRTVTLGINLFDCASPDPEIVKNKIFSRITQLAENLVPICDRIGEKYGIPVVNKRIAVSPIAVVGAALSSSQMVDIAKTLNTRWLKKSTLISLAAFRLWYKKALPAETGP